MQIMPHYDAASKRFLTNSDLLRPSRRAVCSICFASGGVNRAAIKTPLAFCVPIGGRPITFLDFLFNIIFDILLNNK